MSFGKDETGKSRNTEELAAAIVNLDGRRVNLGADTAVHGWAGQLASLTSTALSWDGVVH